MRWTKWTLDTCPTCSEAGSVQGLRQLLQFLLSLQENEVSLIFLHQVHLVNETENFGLKNFEVKEVVVVEITDSPQDCSEELPPNRTDSSADPSPAPETPHQTRRSGPDNTIMIERRVTPATG